MTIDFEKMDFLFATWAKLDPSGESAIRHPFRKIELVVRSEQEVEVVSEPMASGYHLDR